MHEKAQSMSSENSFAVSPAQIECSLSILHCDPRMSSQASNLYALVTTLFRRIRAIPGKVYLGCYFHSLLGDLLAF